MEVKGAWGLVTGAVPWRLPEDEAGRSDGAAARPPDDVRTGARPGRDRGRQARRVRDCDERTPARQMLARRPSAHPAGTVDLGADRPIAPAHRLRLRRRANHHTAHLQGRAAGRARQGPGTRPPSHRRLGQQPHPLPPRHHVRPRQNRLVRPTAPHDWPGLHYRVHPGTAAHHLLLNLTHRGFKGQRNTTDDGLSVLILPTLNVWVHRRTFCWWSTPHRYLRRPLIDLQETTELLTHHLDATTPTYAPTRR